jgi:hypothetical protein
MWEQGSKARSQNTIGSARGTCTEVEYILLIWRSLSSDLCLSRSTAATAAAGYLALALLAFERSVMVLHHNYCNATLPGVS